VSIWQTVRLAVLAIAAMLCLVGWIVQPSTARVVARHAAAPFGQVLSFGGNLQGELGRPSPMNDPAPQSVPLPSAAGGATAIAAGAEHSFAIGSDGRLYAWGSNTYGQLGNSANLGTSTPNPTPTAITLAGASGRVAGAAGGEDVTLALTSSGQVYSFGNNVLGELGRGLNDGGQDVLRPLPAKVPLPGPVRTIAAGEFQGLAVTTADRLFAWGENSHGQLGVSTNAGTETPVTAPVQVPLTHTGRFTSVAAGGEHTLVLTSTGEVFSFGNNRYGQLGRPAPAAGFDASPALVHFPGLSGTIVAIAAGQEHSLALSSSGQLYAFGDNHSGRLGRAAGDGSDTANQTPTVVKTPSKAGAVTQIAAGGDYSLALTSRGIVLAFGDNNYGQLGAARNNGTDAPNPPPTAVSIPGGATLGAVASSADSEHTLVLVGSPDMGTAAIRLRRVSTAGSQATVTATCTISPPQRCAGTITGTSTERLRGRKLIAVGARAKPTGRTVTVLSGHVSIAAGQTGHVTVSLNRAGRRLLDRFYSLPVKLSTGGRGAARLTHFHYTIIRAPIDYFWNFGATYTTVGNLNASQLSPSWHVALTCHGGGCPLSHVALKIHGGRASATSALRGAHLRPGAVLQLAISAPNSVTEVLRFVIAPGHLPRTSALCQTPTQHAPGACYR
jgi:alpha-tubulin suppressor-like RCC1 family protein